MNKKIILIILLILITVLVIIAVNFIISKNNLNTVTLSATVLENNQTSILVEPLEGEDELNSSDKIVVRVPENNATLKNLSEFVPGTKVIITYGGEIMESYPAQINAYKVEKLN